MLCSTALAVVLSWHMTAATESYRLLELSPSHTERVAHIGGNSGLAQSLNTIAWKRTKPSLKRRKRQLVDIQTLKWITPAHTQLGGRPYHGDVPIRSRAAPATNNKALALAGQTMLESCELLQETVTGLHALLAIKFDTSSLPKVVRVGTRCIVSQGTR